MDNVAFVILHYMDDKMTIRCVESLKNIDFGRQYSIIIVDNASPNHSGNELFSHYQKEENIHVIISDANLGFAKGNNLGYQYAKRQCHADFIIIVNNDVLFNEEWRFDVISQIYRRTQAYIIGPDIVSGTGVHQSPLRQSSMKDLKKIRRMIRNRKIYIFYFEIKRKFYFLNQFMLLENILAKEDQKYTEGKQWEREKEGAVLHGACLIFTPLFVEREEEAFDPRTFMYGEEDLLSCKAGQRGYKMLYTPEIHIRHLEENATKQVHAGIEKRIFQYTNALKGYRLLYEELKK